uniref:Uncharacterized protein n=1 Tax=Ixodes ricinus TaxID=34613 RepID=A0A6B0U750_IXORI
MRSNRRSRSGSQRPLMSAISSATSASCASLEPRSPSSWVMFCCRRWYSCSTALSTGSIQLSLASSACTCWVISATDLGSCRNSLATLGGIWEMLVEQPMAS